MLFVCGCGGCGPCFYMIYSAPPPHVEGTSAFFYFHTHRTWTASLSGQAYGPWGPLAYFHTQTSKRAGNRGKNPQAPALAAGCCRRKGVTLMCWPPTALPPPHPRALRARFSMGQHMLCQCGAMGDRRGHTAPHHLETVGPRLRPLPYAAPRPATPRQKTTPRSSGGFFFSARGPLGGRAPGRCRPPRSRYPREQALSRLLPRCCSLGQCGGGPAQSFHGFRSIQHFQRLTTDEPRTSGDLAAQQLHVWIGRKPQPTKHLTSTIPQD